MNKCDATGLAPGLERDEYGKIRAVRLSALTGEACAGCAPRWQNGSRGAKPERATA